MLVEVPNLWERKYQQPSPIGCQLILIVRNYPVKFLIERSNVDLDNTKGKRCDQDTPDPIHHRQTDHVRDHWPVAVLEDVAPSVVRKEILGAGDV